MQQPGRFLLVTVFVVLTLIWGTTWAAIRIGLQGIPPFTGVAVRFAIAAVVLLIAARVRGVRLGALPAEPWLWVANALLSFCISYGVVYWCEQWVPSGLASVLFSTFPLFVVIMSHFALPEERLTLRGALGVLLGFAGVAVIYSQDLSLLGGPEVAFAATVFLLSPFVSAISQVVVKKYGKGVHPFSLTAVPMAITAVVMGSVAFLTERDAPFTFDSASIGALLYLALAGSAVTFSLMYWLLARLSATRVSLIAYTIPVVAVCVGAIFLGEVITPRIIGGSALVLLGVFLAAR
jgi:drug/metabolite transporter (DMT)-like permease